MSINRSIVRLAIPNILSNISVPLLGTVDTALMGRLSESHIAAVGVGGMIFSFLYWNFGFLRMGTTGMTAQALGANNESEISATLGRAIMVAMALAILIFIIQQPFGESGVYLMNVSGEAKSLTAEYFFIRIWDAPATLCLYVLMGWFFGMQNAIYPLIMTIVINVVNMACSFYFIRHLGMEVDGVAWGTVIAQYVGVLLGIGLLFFKYSKYVHQIRLKALTQVEALTSFFRVNRDLFLRTMCLTFAFGFFYSQSSAEGTLLLAVNIILLQYLNWMSYGIDGFAYAAESLVGKYEGANDKIKLNEVIQKSFWWGGGLAILYSLIYGMFGVPLLQIFTDKPDVITAAEPYLIWMAIFPIISFSCYLWDGIFVGLTASGAMRDTMVVSLIVYLLAHFGLTEVWGVHGMWAAFLLFMVVRGVLLWRAYRKISY